MHPPIRNKICIFSEVHDPKRPQIEFCQQIGFCPQIRGPQIGGCTSEDANFAFMSV